METFTATTIFWLMVLGATTGWIVGYIMGREGISVVSNVIWGVVGTPIIGISGLYIELSGVLAFALIGTLAMLFLANVFHAHHDEDISGGIDRGVRILHKE